MTNKFMRKRDKIRAQMKSRWYYSFWGAATVAVVAGQIYVGSGYRALAKSLDKWMDVAVEALINDYKSRGRYTPMFHLQQETLVTELCIWRNLILMIIFFGKEIDAE